MKQSRIALVLLLAVGLAACTEAPRDRSGNHSDDASDAGLFDSQQRALERARAVEDEVLEAARKQREKIEQQGG